MMFRLFPNHSKVIERCEDIGFLPKDPLRYAKAYTKEERDNWFTQITGTKQTIEDIS